MTDVKEVQVSKIVDEVKSQGLFDQLRRTCLDDAESEAAYRRLKDEVDRYCKQFLAKQRWHSGVNKAEMRDRLRDQLLRAGFVSNGVKNLVDRLVNCSKIHKGLYGPVERIVYNHLGLPYPSSDAHSSARSSDREGDSIARNDTGGGLKRPLAGDGMLKPLQQPKRIFLEKDAGHTPSTTGENVASNNVEEETPVQDELCIPPVDPAPSAEFNQLDSSGELSVHWHVTRLSPNPETEEAISENKDHIADDVTNDRISNVIAMEHDCAEVESPAHERL